MSSDGATAELRAREADWKRLEDILARAERRRARRLSDADLLDLPALYRSALSSLSVARETSLDLDLVRYLEALSLRAYFFIYGVRTTPGRRLGAFLRRDWPDAVRSLWRETLVALLLTLLGVAAGWLLVRADPIWFEAFVPGDLAGGRDFSASTAELRGTLYDGGDGGALGAFATFLFTHNSQVAIFAFALGFAFGVPTALLLLYNGATLGAFLALFASRGLGAELGGWLIIHGSTEIFAIVLAGAAGLHIGWAVVTPGVRTRLEAARDAGRTAATAMVGVVLMLLAAGLLEGFGRQLVRHDGLRYAIGLGALGLWLLFFYLPRRRDG